MIRFAAVALFAVIAAATGQAAPAAQERVIPALGPAKAASQIEVFLDFTDDACGRLSVVLDALVARHPKDVRLVFRHSFPEHDADRALPHRAALAAERQGRFWEMARLLFANQDRHGREDVLGMAAQLGLDVPRFSGDLDDPALDLVLAEDHARAVELRVAAAPAIFVNAAPMTGERTLKHLESLVAPKH